MQTDWTINTGLFFQKQSGGAESVVVRGGQLSEYGQGLLRRILRRKHIGKRRLTLEEKSFLTQFWRDVVDAKTRGTNVQEECTK